jgi:hypothetical protein
VIAFDADLHPTRSLFRRQISPLGRQMLGDQRVQPGQPDQAFGEPLVGQPIALFIDQLHVIVIPGPVITDEQHPRLPRLNDPTQQQQETPSDFMAQCSPLTRGTSSHQRSHLLTTGRRTVCREASPFKGPIPDSADPPAATNTEPSKPPGRSHEFRMFTLRRRVNS